MEQEKITEEKAKQIVKRSSVSGTLALYAFIQSYEQNIAFDKIKIVNDNPNFGGSDYFYGFLVAFFSMELIQFNVVDDIITATYVDENLLNQVKKTINEWLKNETILHRVNEINTYFKQSPVTKPIK